MDIQIDTNDRQVYLFIVKKGNYEVSMSNTGGSIYDIESDEEILYWSDEDIEYKESFIAHFPDYPIFAKHLDMDMGYIFHMLRVSDTYDDLIKRLEDTIPIPAQECITYETRFNYFEYINDKLISIKMHLDESTYIKVGDCEYRNSEGIYTYTDLMSIPQYKLLQDIIKTQVSIESIRKISNTLDIYPIQPDKYMYALYDMITYIPDNIKIEKPSSDSPWICIKNEESDRCDDGDGIPSCIALIRENEWKNLSLIIEMYPNRFKYEADYSSGGHGCIIEYDLHQMIKQCTIIDNLSDEVIQFIQKVQDKAFIDAIRYQVQNLHNSINMDQSYDTLLKKYF